MESGKEPAKDLRPFNAESLRRIMLVARVLKYGDGLYLLILVRQRF